MITPHSYQYKYGLDGRYYDFGFELILPGVTSILNKTKSAKEQACLHNWRKRVGEQEANRISKEASDRGNKLHNCIEYALVNKKKDPQRRNILSWWQQAEPLIHSILTRYRLEATELPVFSKQYKYAGKLDCLLSNQGKYYLVDWKTSSKPKKPEWIKDYYLQLAAYAYALKEMHGIEIYKGVIAIFLEHDSPQIFEVHAPASDKETRFFSEFVQRIDLFYANSRA